MEARSLHIACIKLLQSAYIDHATFDPLHACPVALLYVSSCTVTQLYKGSKVAYSTNLLCYKIRSSAPKKQRIYYYIGPALCSRLHVMWKRYSCKIIMPKIGDDWSHFVRVQNTGFDGVRLPLNYSDKECFVVPARLSTSVATYDKQ